MSTEATSSAEVGNTPENLQLWQTFSMVTGSPPMTPLMLLQAIKEAGTPQTPYGLVAKVAKDVPDANIGWRNTSSHILGADILYKLGLLRSFESAEQNQYVVGDDPELAAALADVAFGWSLANPTLRLVPLLTESRYKPDLPGGPAISFWIYRTLLRQPDASMTMQTLAEQVAYEKSALQRKIKALHEIGSLLITGSAWKANCQIFPSLVEPLDDFVRQAETVLTNPDSRAEHAKRALTILENKQQISTLLGQYANRSTNGLELDSAEPSPHVAELLLLLDKATNPLWREVTACSGTDPEIFFSTEQTDTQKAKKICKACDARAECLDWGLYDKDGIFGGADEDEREALRLHLDRQRNPAHPKQEEQTQEDSAD